MLGDLFGGAFDHDLAALVADFGAEVGDEVGRRKAGSRPCLGFEKRHYDKSPGEIDLDTPIGPEPP